MVVGFTTNYAIIAITNNVAIMSKTNFTAHFIQIKKQKII